jgi:hypothetical protein
MRGGGSSLLRGRESIGLYEFSQTQQNHFDSTEFDREDAFPRRPLPNRKKRALLSAIWPLYFRDWHFSLHPAKLCYCRY